MADFNTLSTSLAAIARNEPASEVLPLPFPLQTLPQIRRPGLKSVAVELNPHPCLQRMKDAVDRTIAAEIPPVIEYFHPFLTVASHQEWQLLCDHVNHQLESQEWRFWQTGQELVKVTAALGLYSEVVSTLQLLDKSFSAYGPGTMSIVSLDAHAQGIRRAQMLKGIVICLTLLWKKKGWVAFFCDRIVARRREALARGIAV